MKTYIHIFAIKVLLLNIVSINSQMWQLQNSGTTNNINDIEFINANTGFAVSDSVLLSTSNGGINWTILQVNFAPILKKVAFLNSTTGFLINRIGGDNTNSIYKTTDGGITWILNYQHSHPQTDICTADSNTVVIGTEHRRIIKTTNKGLNWTEFIIPSNLCEVVCNTFFTNSLTGFVTSYTLYSAPPPIFKGFVLKTTNGGLGWLILDDQIGGAIFIAQQEMISFASNQNPLDDTIIYINYLGQRIHRTTNTGANWNVDVISNTNLNDIVFINLSTGWACGTNGIVYKTIDGGYIWTHTSTATTKNLNTIWFVNDHTGWAAGKEGVIIKTTSGGVTILNHEYNFIPDAISLSQNYPNPFNPSTNIKFQMPKSGFVKLVVCNLLGKEIQTLVNQELSSGTYSVDFDGSNLPSAVYYYRLETNAFTETKKMVLIK